MTRVPAVIEDDGFPPLEMAAPLSSPTGDAALALPENGNLSDTSTVRLYAIAAVTSATGWLQLELDQGRMLQISFRRGTPEHLSSDAPELSLLRFLQSRALVTAEQGFKADEQSSKSGQDLVSVLFQMQLIPPADAHKILGDHSMFLLDRALTTCRGKFGFEADAPAPPGAFPLGQRWTLLAEAVRRLEPAPLRARLGKRLLRPVMRSGGLGIGQVEQLALNAQEARLFGSIDGTRTGEELLKQQDASTALRMLYLLTELGHLAFGELLEATPPAPPQTAPPTPAPPQTAPTPAPARTQPAPPELPASAAKSDPMRTGARELPKIARPPPPGWTGAASTKAAPAKPANAPSAVSRPPPLFAASPQSETPSAMLARLQALLARLQKADHFEALGLDRKAMSPGEAKRNFFVLAKELHPDTVTDPSQTELHEVKAQLFARINEASQVLSDEVHRKAYEQELEGAASNVDVGRIFAAEESFRRAEIMIKARKYADGLALLEEALRLNADEAEFYAWRGYARFLIAKDRRSAFPEAAGDCRQAIRMIDKCVPAHLFLGHMAKAMGDLKLAEQCYHRVLQLEPRNVEAQRELRLMGKK